MQHSTYTWKLSHLQLLYFHQWEYLDGITVYPFKQGAWDSRCLSPDKWLLRNVSKWRALTLVTLPFGWSQTNQRSTQIQSKLWEIPNTFLEVYWKQFHAAWLELQKHVSPETIFEHKRNTSLATCKHTHTDRKSVQILSSWIPWVV